VVALRYVSACVGSLGNRLRHETPGVGRAVRRWGGGNARAITSSDRSWAGPGPGQ
jgi:hypothetical protein